MYSRDRKVVTVFNGQIYNYRQLREALEARGHDFVTSSDTEVIVYAWREWGPGCVERMRGMFAFAVWDADAQTLFLARDRIGIKPLHFSVTSDGHLVFGSELKAVLRHPEVSRVIDPRAVEEYFAFGYVPDPRTIFEHVHKLAPATA